MDLSLFILLNNEDPNYDPKEDPQVRKRRKLDQKADLDRSKTAHEATKRSVDSVLKVKIPKGPPGGDEDNSTQVGYFGLTDKKKPENYGGSTGTLGKAPKFNQPASRKLYTRSIVGRGTSRKLARQFKGFRRGRYWGQRPGRNISTGGNRIRSVVKVRYQRSHRNVDIRARLKAHVNYLQHRERGAFEKKEERMFFSPGRNDLDGKLVFREAMEKITAGVGYQKIILSPGDNSINLKEYTREVMEAWQGAMGREFDWYAIAHRNTDHYHVHVLIPGRDWNDRFISFDREDLLLIRQISNQYLERERLIDRTLDREVARDLYGVDKDISEKLLALGYERVQDAAEKVHGLFRDFKDMQKEWKDLGLGRIYELGRPFEGLNKVKSEPKAKESKEVDKELDKGIESEGLDEKTAEGEAKDVSNTQPGAGLLQQGKPQDGNEELGQPGMSLDEREAQIERESSGSSEGVKTREEREDDESGTGQGRQR